MGSTIVGWIDTQTGTSGSGSTTYYATTDQLGSVTQVTNSTGTVVWASEYTPYGGLAGAQGTYNFTGFFTGKDIDPDTGLYYFNARWYDPELGRFVSEDPAGQGTNWYSYCGNNPQTYTDPSGKDLVSALIGGIIGAIVGGVTAWEEGYGPTTWQFWGDVGLDAGIGALAGAGDFAAWAGVTPGALAGEGISGAAQAAIIGGVNAGVAGFVTGFGNSLINGGSVQSAFQSGFEGLGSGLVLGGVMSYIGYSFQQAAAQAAAQQQQLDAEVQHLDVLQFQSQSDIESPYQVATADVADNQSYYDDGVYHPDDPSERIDLDIVNPHYTVSNAGLGQLEADEGSVIDQTNGNLMNYNDSQGFGTSGYGHLINGYQPLSGADIGGEMTPESAYAQLQNDATSIGNIVNNRVNNLNIASLTQTQFDALEALTFNSPQT